MSVLLFKEFHRQRLRFLPPEYSLHSLAYRQKTSTSTSAMDVVQLQADHAVDPHVPADSASDKEDLNFEDGFHMAPAVVELHGVDHSANPPPLSSIHQMMQSELERVISRRLSLDVAAGVTGADMEGTFCV
ncbi:hypothetical protein BV898_05125 [Hypsibius exemplaris]|uniref:Uncharacterized protein n=1 Tax=Hypsibius exemplaris TaxID=2072580 RepID=A0A1W0X187_HYPEX|nr:hypothetical protein BV898_05125 [Hypsibius exemplaris]